ncbi:MAG: DUF1788 domain-containing protein [Cloacibacillus porcorum]|uniref:DUF1788 domain-containing protein n=1 Tax=Cloacibacillus porcorum TaxID=1197717 RepID=UPI002353CA08|nr:DUF1788 domain-containing protein [Cloacibacillus porcorum]MCI5863823.1 DUF1788 domain-containing protein [Cloacibacillus porcorum]
MADIETRLSRLEMEIKNPRFMENRGVGNEVRYYVFDYPAEQELIIRAWVRDIVRKNKNNYTTSSIVVFDLYEMIISFLKEKGFMEKCYEFEKNRGLTFLAKTIGDAMRFSTDDSIIIRRIQNDTPDNAIVFLTGVGKCFPILRSHKVLNNLHQVMDKVPVIMFYPGKYDGQELVLFLEVKDDNYYRAFKLID